jgi:hypothetical protein
VAAALQHDPATHCPWVADTGHTAPLSET